MQDPLPGNTSTPILIKNIPTRKLHSTKIELVGRQCAALLRCGEFVSASQVLNELLLEASTEQKPIIDGMLDVCSHIESIQGRQYSSPRLDMVTHLLSDGKRLTLSDIRKHRGYERSRLLGIKYVTDHLVGFV
jgi:hypothetical protein